MTEKQTAAKLVLCQLRVARASINGLSTGQIKEAAGKQRMQDKKADTVKEHANKFIDPLIERLKKLSGETSGSTKDEPEEGTTTEDVTPEESANEPSDPTTSEEN